MGAACFEMLIVCTRVWHERLAIKSFALCGLKFLWERKAESVFSTWWLLCLPWNEECFEAFCFKGCFLSPIRTKNGKFWARCNYFCSWSACEGHIMSKLPLSGTWVLAVRDAHLVCVPHYRLSQRAPGARFSSQEFIIMQHLSWVISAASHTWACAGCARQHIKSC